MEQGKKHIIYTAEDIHQYFSGKLSPAEMHAIEKAALDDPFLEEAMEGYSEQDKKEWEKQLLLLRQQFSPQPGAKLVPISQVKKYHLFKVAAAVIVLCSGIALTYLVTKPGINENKSLAVNKSTQAATDSPIVESSIKDSIHQPMAPAIKNTATNPGKPVTSTPAEQALNPDSSFLYRPEKQTARPTAKGEAGGGYVDDVQNKTADLTTANAAPTNLERGELKAEKPSVMRTREAGPITANPQEQQQPLRQFEAQVVGADGNPLPFANISIPRDQVGTYTDVKGKFRLVAADSLLNIEIKSAGHISRNYTLRSNLVQSKIILVEDHQALKEKTMVAGNTAPLAKKQRAALVPDSVINVEPADGWQNYDTYITNNLMVPEDIRQKKIQGEVEISFDVERNGAITNMKIDKSLCADCDEAAMRVIKEGPRWKVKKGRRATARVKVKF